MISFTYGNKIHFSNHINYMSEFNGKKLISQKIKYFYPNDNVFLIFQHIFLWIYVEIFNVNNCHVKLARKPIIGLI